MDGNAAVQAATEPDLVVVMGVSGSGMTTVGEGIAAASAALRDAAAAGAGAFAVFWAIGAAFRAGGRDALGFGDVKLAGACAVSLTPADAALALEVAALGAIAVLLATRRGGTLRDTAVPFGAFLAPAAWLVLVLAPPLRDAGLMISWLLDTAPDGAFDVAWDQVPPALRLAHRVWWRRRYERTFGTIGAVPAPVGLPFALAA